MAKKLKLKKEGYYGIAIIIILIIGIIFSVVKFKEYKYHQTYEYKLLEHGYKEDEVKSILNTLNNKEYLEYLLNNPVNSKYANLSKEKYYLEKNFFNYAEYMKKNEKLDLPTIIRNVNIHLDKEFYSLNLSTNTSLDTSMLVNKYYLLTKDYVPEDLVTISQDYSWGELGSKEIREVAYDAFKEMWNAAKEVGYHLMVNSAYRSFENQESIYENYKRKDGQSAADDIAARPGASEHQTGLALDIFSTKNPSKKTFENSPEATWLKENAHKYGFILRFPKDKENVTGYKFEPWHYRYVGIDIATYIYKNDITFEEYYAYYIEK